jgi:hypothetical protein
VTARPSASSRSADPWITGSYFGVDDPEKFRDDWLRTGDIGTMDAEGFMVVSDRTKDVIKSGGEWISSVELEATMMAHPAVFEAAVIAVPDEKWQERPLCCVVLQPDATASAEELRDFLAERVAKWWLPERWTFIDTVPKTSVGKFDKKVLRAEYAENELEVRGRRLVESFDDAGRRSRGARDGVSPTPSLTCRARAVARRGRRRVAKELERQLSKVRRSLQKAEMLLRGASDD